MLTRNEINYLRRLAHPLEPIFQVGKEGVSDNLVDQLGRALEARELIKIRVLRSAAEGEEEIGRTLTEELQADLVQSIGHILVLYRRSKKKPKIDLRQA